MLNSQYKILIIDPEVKTLRETSQLLKAEGYTVFSSGNSEEGLRLCKTTSPHLILLEMMIDHFDGIDICTELREEEKMHHVVIAFYSKRKENYSQIAALNAGADDFVSKPANTRLLLSKVDSWLRRFKFNGNVMEINNKYHSLRIDRDKYLVYLNDTEIKLPKKEFEILSLFISKPGKVFSRTEIKEDVWDDKAKVNYRTIDVHIRKLREKVGQRLIKTVKGIGYKLEA